MHFDRQQSDLLLNFESILVSYLSSIQQADEWTMDGFRCVHDERYRMKYHLIYQLEQNVHFFRTVHRSSIECVQLEKVPVRLRHDSQEMIHPDALTRFAQDTELVQQAEHVMSIWIEQIHRVHIE
jgi:hypothetical protein